MVIIIYYRIIIINYWIIINNGININSININRSCPVLSEIVCNSVNSLGKKYLRDLRA